MGNRNAKFGWDGKVGNPAQIGGIETAVVDNGLARGNRIAWVNTGSGLRYKVVIDRALDISEAFYNQHSLVWLNHSGLLRGTARGESGRSPIIALPGMGYSCQTTASSS